MKSTLLLLSLLFAAQSFAQPEQPISDSLYVVQPGDTYASIASKFDVSMDALIVWALNGDTPNSKKIPSSGDTLFIPCRSAQVWAATNVFSSEFTMQLVNVRFDGVVNILYHPYDGKGLFTYQRAESGSAFVVSFQKGTVNFMRSWIIVDDNTSIFFNDAWRNNVAPGFIFEQLGVSFSALPKSLRDDLALLKK